MLFFISQVLVGTCSVPFVENSMLNSIGMYTMRTQSNRVIYMGITVALVVLLLLGNLKSLKYSIYMYEIPYW